MQATKEEQISIFKDAIARWQTYEDRRITPANGGGVGLNGKACALGDIAANLGLDAWCKISPEQTCAYSYLDLGRMMDSYRNNSDLGSIFWRVNDNERRWPIQEAWLFVQWEEADLNFDISNYTSKKELVNCL